MGAQTGIKNIGVAHPIVAHGSSFSPASAVTAFRQSGYDMPARERAMPGVAIGALGRFSNRPFGVKRFQTIHHHSVDVARGLVLLFGIGAKPFHYGGRGRGGTIFRAALPSEGRQVQATKRTHLIHRPARDIFPPQGGTRVSSYRI